MRISDWSSDVCSSDLTNNLLDDSRHKHEHHANYDLAFLDVAAYCFSADQKNQHTQNAALAAFLHFQDVLYGSDHFARWFAARISRPRRSEERRVGKECVSTCRCRGSAEH